MQYTHELTADEAKPKILDGSLPEDTFVRGHLDLKENESLTEIPAGLRGCWSIDLTGCSALTTLPAGLRVNRLVLDRCVALTSLPEDLQTFEIRARETRIEHIPTSVTVDYKLDLSDNHVIEALPNGLRVGSLDLVNCTNLESLPDGLDLYFLDATGCRQLKTWGESGNIQVGHITLANCVRLTYLPNWFGTITQLNITNCEALTSLPDNLRVTSRIDLAGSGLTALPEGAKGASLRWNDVEVDERIVFQPETITAEEIFDTENVELRRVKIERIGYDEFFRQAEAEEIDRDMDAGGVRRLLRIEWGESQQRRNRQDEPLVCLSVVDPSTGRSYILRVPPTTSTCREAAAWIAGFDNPDDYQPVIET
ncbi:MAG: DUF6745 domain-containing protein [Chloroflexota bacterium]